MNKKKLFAIAACVLFAILINIYIFAKVKPDVSSATARFEFSFVSDCEVALQVFYSDNTDFSEERSQTVSYTEVGSESSISVSVPVDSAYLRIDFGDAANRAEIKNPVMCVANQTLAMGDARFTAAQSTSFIEEITEDDGIIQIAAEDGDPYVVISLEDMQLVQQYEVAGSTGYLIRDILLCAIVDLMALICIRYLMALVSIPLAVYRDRRMFWDLTKNDFQARFAGSYFGVIWAFIQPVVTLLLYWFVFQVGLRAGRVSDYPFILFLMSGMIPWFYFSEALSGGTSSLMEYSYLVKKVVFDVNILPVLKVVSAIFVHLFFTAFLMIICFCYGYTPSLCLLQLLYYIPAMSFLVLGLSYITAACTAFFRDMTQIINIILTVGVWITPIMWNPVETLSPVLITVFRLNPMYYIVDGFRDTLLAKAWFWDKPVWTIYFWTVCILIYLLGLKMFNRLKVHFADVL